MSNARLSVLQARAVKDKRITDAQFRTLAALGMYADVDGWCFPSLTTLGQDLGKSKQAVGKDTIALRKLGYLEVQPRFNENGGRRSSMYRLKFDLPRQSYVDTPSTPEVDTPSTPEVDVNVPINVPLITDKQSLKDSIEKNLSIENAIFLGKEVTKDIQQRQSIKDIAPKQFENALGFSKPLPWWSNKEWTSFAEWVCAKYSESKIVFGEYNIWRNTKYTKGGLSNSRIRGFVAEFYDSWDMFMMSKQPVQEEPTRPEYQKFVPEDTSNVIPNPFKKPDILSRKSSLDSD